MGRNYVASSGDNVSYGDTTFHDGYEQYSVACRVFLRDNTVDHYMISKYSGSTGLIFATDAVGSVSGRQKTFAVFIRDAGGSSAKIEGEENAAATGKWIPVVATIDVASGGVMDLFWGNKKDANSGVSSSAVDPFPNNSTPLKIGQKPDTSTLSMDGIIADPAFWYGVKLTDQEAFRYLRGVPARKIRPDALFNPLFRGTDLGDARLGISGTNSGTELDNDPPRKKRSFIFIPAGAAGGVTVNVPAASLTLTGNAPTIAVSDHKTINVPAASLTLTGNAPTVLTPKTVSVPLATLGLAGLVPAANVTDHITVNVPAATLSLSGFAPLVNISDHKTVDVPTATLGLTGFAPTVTASGDKVINVPAANLSLTGYAATIQTPNTINIPVANLTLTGNAPDAKTPNTINIPVGSLTLTGIAPGVQVSDNQMIEIPLANLALSGFAPTVGKSSNIPIPVASLTLTGLVPVVIGAQRIGYLTAEFTLASSLQGSITLDPALDNTETTIDPSVDGSITLN